MAVGHEQCSVVVGECVGGFGQPGAESFDVFVSVCEDAGLDEEGAQEVTALTGRERVHIGVGELGVLCAVAQLGQPRASVWSHQPPHGGGRITSFAQ